MGLWVPRLILNRQSGHPFFFNLQQTFNHGILMLTRRLLLVLVYLLSGFGAVAQTTTWVIWNNTTCTAYGSRTPPPGGIGVIAQYSPDSGVSWIDGSGQPGTVAPGATYTYGVAYNNSFRYDVYDYSSAVAISHFTEPAGTWGNDGLTHTIQLQQAGYGTGGMTCGGTNNYTAYVTNSAGVPGVAWFKFNGVLVFQQLLQPGGIAQHTYQWSGNGDINYGLSLSATVATTDQNGLFTLTNIQLGSSVDSGSVASPPSGLSLSNLVPPQVSQSNLLTGGFINWNSTDTTAARDATLKAGFNQMASDDSAQLGALNAIKSELGTNGGGGGTTVVSNNLTVPYTSNMFNLMTNYNASAATNDAQALGALGGTMGTNLMNQLNGQLGPISNAVTSAGAGAPGASAETADTGFGLDITPGTMQVGSTTPSMPTFRIKLDITDSLFSLLDYVKAYAASILYFILFAGCTNRTFNEIQGLMGQPKFKIPNISVLGTNFAAAAYPVLAAIFVGVVFTVVVQFVGILMGGVGAVHMVDMGTNMARVQGNAPSVWAAVAKVWPVADSLACMMGAVTFMIIARTVGTGARAVIALLPS